MTSPPYTVRLDADSARELAQRGGTILLLDVPENTAVGVDQQVGARAAGCRLQFTAAAAAAAARPPQCRPPLLRRCPFMQTFLVGPKFKGIKMVPPGTHFISYNSSSGQGDFGPTTSFFLPIRIGQVRSPGR